MKLEAIPCGINRFAVRPQWHAGLGQGTAWGIVYVNAKSASEAIHKAEIIHKRTVKHR